MGCNFEGNWKHTLGTKQINFRLKENKFRKLKEWKRNIFQNICLCGKTFPQNYPTHSAALKNRKKDGPRISCLAKLQNLILAKSTTLSLKKVQQRRLVQVFFEFLDASDSLDESFFKIFINKYWHESAKYRSNQYVLLWKFTWKIAYLKIFVRKFSSEIIAFLRYMLYCRIFTFSMVHFCPKIFF